MLAQYFAPPTVIVNAKGDIVHLHGRTGQFLEPASGVPRLNVIDMAREGLRTPLTTAISKCISKERTVSVDRVTVKTNGDYEEISFEVSKIDEPESMRGLLMITLRPYEGKDQSRAKRSAMPPPASRKGSRQSHAPIQELELELQYTKEHLQSTIEELETTNEELKSSNEELQSTNEELQSANEELETSKEEMQSINEEVHTVNSELQKRVEDLTRVNNDMQNLLNSRDIATIFLDTDLNIKRFTSQINEVINLIPSDVGRSISDLVTKLDYEDLSNDCREVLRTLVFKEADVRTHNGSWYSMRIVPYRTVDNFIEGLIITFIGIDKLKNAESQIGLHVHTIRAMLDLQVQPAIVVDGGLKAQMSNRRFREWLAMPTDEQPETSVIKLFAGRFNGEKLKAVLEDDYGYGVERTVRLESSFTGQKPVEVSISALLKADEPKRLLMKFFI